MFFSNKYKKQLIALQEQNVKLQEENRKLSQLKYQNSSLKTKNIELDNYSKKILDRLTDNKRKYNQLSKLHKEIIVKNEQLYMKCDNACLKLSFLRKNIDSLVEILEKSIKLHLSGNILDTKEIKEMEAILNQVKEDN